MVEPLPDCLMFIPVVDIPRTNACHDMAATADIANTYIQNPPSPFDSATATTVIIAIPMIRTESRWPAVRDNPVLAGCVELMIL